MSAPIRFGPFEVIIATGELRKNGRQVRIQEQPFQILAALLEHPGEVVTREQLCERLWPGDSFGDFDQGLNTAINKLRDALGDSPADPKYIETLPKRGYRFLFPLDGEPVQSTPPRRFHWIAAALAASAFAGGFAVWLLRPAGQPELRVRRFVVEAPDQKPATIASPSVVISPDGQSIAFISGGAGDRLWVRELHSLSPRPVRGTEDVQSLFWSPNSGMLAFSTHRRLMKVPAKGGTPVPVCDLPAAYTYGGSWSPRGDSIVFSAGNPAQLYEVAAAGGAPKLLLTEQAAQSAAALAEQKTGFFVTPHLLPSWPSRRLIAYSLGDHNPSLLLHDLDSGSIMPLGRGKSPSYVEPGFLLYARPEANDVWAVPISLTSLKPTGEAFRVASGAQHPSASRDGTLVYRDAPYEQLAWFTREGKRTGLIGTPVRGVYYPAISPDGSRVAMETDENANLDLWVLDVSRRSRIRLTSHHATDILPVWSPDGQQIAYGSYRNGSVDIWLRNADGSGEEKLLLGGPRHERVSDWSRDGRYILYSLRAEGSRSGDLWYLERDAPGHWESKPFLETSADERIAKLSPDGRYAAYISEESGRPELYVRPFPRGERKWAISSGGGGMPRWSRDGKEIFFTANGSLFAVPVTTSPEFAAGIPVRLFFHPTLADGPEPYYDVSADRQRILLPERVGGNEIRIQVVENWLAEFRGGAGK